VVGEDQAESRTTNPAGGAGHAPWLPLSLIDHESAAPGAEVAGVWGEHPGPGADPDADLGFPRIRATVAPAPYDAHARTRYRRH
jgi:vanillate/3-O-methylgallate O-demethylase